MSSGLPPILTAAQPAAANGFSFNQGFAQFGYLFPPIPPAVVQQSLGGQGSASSSQQSTAINRFKVKRHRQRVDAGEPRNTYQGTSSSSSSSSSNTSTSSATSSLPLVGATSSSTATGTAVSEAPSMTSMMLPKKKAEETRSDETVADGQQPQENNQSPMIAADEHEDVVNGGDVGDDEDDGEEEEDVGNELEENELEEFREESPGSNGSAASKRKSFLPQKIGEQLGIEIGEEPEQINVTVGASVEENDEVAEEPEHREMSALQSQLQNGNIAEAQRRIYMTFLEQQKKQMLLSQQNKINYDQLLTKLNHELMNGFMKTVDKIVREWAAEQEVVVPPAPPPAPFHPIFPGNPLFHLQNPHPMGAGGIFPPNFNAFTAFNALRRNLQDAGDASEIKKKRARIEMKREEVVSSRASPLSASASPPLGTSTPMSRFFPPPTMVGYGAMNFCGGDREDSPTNSDELSDSGFEGTGTSSMLTPMHLRKAKLMFFYTRYPNSNLLKSYFPDIRFNKGNTAQLVKWFSNFREFYYIQMEKFGRQLLAEGVRDRSEIVVTKNSELFKVLNTHYNRNNHIEPPDNLVRVVQETLREFYDAIKLGKDSEPSWKKTIYKVINRMDDPIPDRFKDPNFLGSLE